MRFWFDKGVDGFRMDVIPFISKDTTFPPLPASYRGNYVAYYAKGPQPPRVPAGDEPGSAPQVRRHDRGRGRRGDGGGRLESRGRRSPRAADILQFELADRWGRRPGN